MTTKTTRNRHGTFVATRHDASIEFVCDRCLRPKIGKVVVDWTPTSGPSKRICNACYGRLLSGVPLQCEVQTILVDIEDKLRPILEMHPAFVRAGWRWHLGVRASEAAQMGGGLPPLLAPGLNVVFVGTEPGPESLRTESYYANSRNSFWRDLFEVGLTPTVIAPSAYARALALGIGLDDVYQDPIGLRRRIEAVAPKAVCFNSKAALARVVTDEIEGAWAGEDAGRWTTFPKALVWALHDSSPTAVAYRALRLRELGALVARIEAVGR